MHFPYESDWNMLAWLIFTILYLKFVDYEPTNTSIQHIALTSEFVDDQPAGHLHHAAV